MSTVRTTECVCVFERGIGRERGRGRERKRESGRKRERGRGRDKEKEGERSGPTFPALCPTHRLLMWLLERFPPEAGVDVPQCQSSLFLLLPSRSRDHHRSLLEYCAGTTHDNITC